MFDVVPKARGEQLNACMMLVRNGHHTKINTLIREVYKVTGTPVGSRTVVGNFQYVSGH